MIILLIQNIDDNIIENTELENYQSWTHCFHKVLVVNSALNFFMQFEITNARIVEFDKWKTHIVYDTVNKFDHKFITLMWVLSEK